MALSLLVNSVDRTSVLFRDSLNIEQAADTFASTCSFSLLDRNGGLTVSAREEIEISDNGTTLFKGEVSGIEREIVIMGSSERLIHVEAQDYNILLEETVVEEELYEAAMNSDSAIIADLIATYRSDIGASTYVSTLDPATEELFFEAVTLRQALSDLCALTGGTFYVDFDKELHYFSSESNVAAFYLSDSPSGNNPLGYESIRERSDASMLANRFYILGNDVLDWEEDATSVAAYGEREAPIKDNALETDAAVNDRGSSLLATYKDPQLSYTVTTTNGAFLRAGMDIRLVNSVLGVDTTLTIRRLTIGLREDEFVYELEIGAPDSGATGGSRSIEDRIKRIGDNVDRTSQAVFDTVPPSAPTLLTANLTTGVDIDADGHQIVYLQVTWGSVSADDLDHYQVQVSTSSDFSGYTITRDHPSDGDRLERFVGLLGNTTYYVRVRAVDWSGNNSDWSTTRNTTTSADSTPPAQVSGLSAGSSRTLVGLQWTANTEADLAEYEIQRAPDSGGSPGAWSTVAVARLNFYVDEDFTDQEIVDQDTFWYRVRATDTSGNDGSWSSNTSVQLGQIDTDHIAASAITADKIAANTITADKMNVSQLSAIAADMGTITAGVVTGATIRTAASGAQVVMDSTDGLRGFNSSGTMTFQLDVDGSGQLGATGQDPLIWNSSGQLDKINANQIQISMGGGNLLSNSAFLVDDNDDGVPDDWTSAGTASHYDVDQETTTVLIGDYSVKMQLTSGNSSDQYRDLRQLISTEDVAVGDAFTASVYVNVSAISNARARMYLVAYSGGAYHSGIIGDYVDETTSGWQRLTVSGTVPSGADGVGVWLRVQATANDGTVTAYFDGVQLERGDYVTSWKPSLLGNVSIDAARVEVVDGDGSRVWMGKSGSDFGFFTANDDGQKMIGILADDDGSEYIKLYNTSGTVIGRIGRYSLDYSEDDVVIERLASTGATLVLKSGRIWGSPAFAANQYQIGDTIVSATWVSGALTVGEAYIGGTEISDPSAPSANQGRLYFRDNGAGKTQLCVRFNTGAIQVLATQP